MTVNRWQRLVLIFASAVCLLHAAAISSDSITENHPGSAFVAGILFLLIGLSNPAPGEARLPSPRNISPKVRNGAMIAAGMGVLLIVFLVFRPRNPHWNESEEAAAVTASEAADTATQAVYGAPANAAVNSLAEAAAAAKEAAAASTNSYVQHNPFDQFDTKAGNDSVASVPPADPAPAPYNSNNDRNAADAAAAAATEASDEAARNRRE
jgi:hypothetical protein